MLQWQWRACDLEHGYARCTDIFWATKIKNIVGNTKYCTESDYNILSYTKTLSLIFDPQNGSKRYRREWASCCLGWIWIPIWVTVIWYESFERTTFSIQSWIRQRLRLEWHPHRSRLQDRMRLPFGSTLSARYHPRTFLPNTHILLCTHLGHKSSPILGPILDASNLQISNQNYASLYLCVSGQPIRSEYRFIK